MRATPGQGSASRRCRAWRLLRLSAMALALVSLWPALGSAQELLLSNLILNNYEGKIRVRFGVEPTGLERIRAALDHGETLALNGKAVLALRRDYLWNQEVAHARCRSILQKLSTGEYSVSLPGQEGSMADRDLAALFHKAWGEILLDLGPWSLLERGKTYALDLDLVLTRLDVSPWVKKGLFFWSFDVAPSVSYQLDFTY